RGGGRGRLGENLSGGGAPPRGASPTGLPRPATPRGPGHHCAQPALAHYGLESAARASFALYNTPEEVDELVTSLQTLQQSA
ncbi:aminotransferase class V-fold PLP-dependent enzyme, partial [Streptomyces violascens]|uniref:aminotransferase class V-fold PLP-dependent enzyme n=1 Tax=Streptomyces violascens TaxID=67381 RepID=UPI0036953A96